MAEDTSPTPDKATQPVPTPEPEATPITPETPAPQTPPVAQPAPTHTPSGPANGLAIAAMVVGIVAVITGWIPFWGLLVGATAIVLGILGLKKATGKGMAISGIITGAIGALWGLLVVVFFVIALTLGASVANTASEALREQAKESQELSDSKKEFTKGEVAQFGDLEVTVNSVQKAYNPGQYYNPADGKEFIVIDVTIKNTSDKPEYLSTYDFKIVDNGVAQTNSYAPAEKKISGGEIASGDSTTGTLVYEVTKGATDLKLQYDTTIYDPSEGAKKLVYTLAL